MRNLTPFFQPQSIAIVGASNNTKTISGKPLVYLQKHGYHGTLYPVNPKYDHVQGWKCYPDLKALPQTPDVAMLIVRADRIKEQLEACKKKGIGHALIISSGFAEADDEGARQQKDLVQYARDNGIALIGPNSQGLVNLVDQTALSFSGSLERESLVSGDIGFISQSGAFGNSVFSLAQDEGIGFAYIACTGNEADVNTFDVMEWMLEDDQVRVIACYNEGFRDGSRFRDLSERSREKKKPILWFKSGKSEVGQRAAGSHTGALAGEDAVFNSLIHQYGMLRVNDIHEIFDAVEIFRGGRYPKGRKVGVLTTSGGTGVMLSDELIELGFEVPRLSDQVQQELGEVLPAFAALENPVDVTAQVVAQPELFQLTGEILAKHEAVDVICISATMVVGEAAKKVADAIVELHRNTSVPVIVSWTIDKSRNQYATDQFKANGIPLLQTPVRAAHALKRLMRFSEFLQDKNEEVPSLPGGPLSEWIPSGHFTEHTVKKALSDSGFPVPDGAFVHTSEEAVAEASKIGYPVVLKIVSEEIQHKTEIGGVTVGIQNHEEMREAFAAMQQRMKQQNLVDQVDGFLIEEMAEQGIELILGATNHAPYGPVVTVGFGGIWVEVLKDVTYRQAPFSQQEARKMLRELKGYRMLEGYRGTDPVDVDQLSKLISDFSKLIDSIDDFAEIEMNPLMVTAKGTQIVDALCVPKHSGGFVKS